LIGGTISPDYQVPGIGPLIQRKLTGCRQIPAIDLRSGCTVILQSLQLARALLLAGLARHVVCFGAEAQSRGLDLHRRSAELSMLFGDGAGALVISRDLPENASGVIRLDDVLIETDGSFAEDLCVRGAAWESDETTLLPFMNGRAVILHAVRKMCDAAGLVMRRNEITPEQIALVVPHQANANLLRALGTQMGMPADRIVSTVAQTGNTSGASAFIALAEAKRTGRLQALAPGDHVLLPAFGAGFSWGAALGTITR
ncbi:MAG: 3-oxoacyl-ACP synthase III family protein, partial [Blastocatellia bacterium]